MRIKKAFGQRRGLGAAVSAMGNCPRWEGQPILFAIVCHCCCCCVRDAAREQLNQTATDATAH